MPDNNPFAEEQERRKSAGGNPFAAEIERRGSEPSANFTFRERFARRAMNNLMAVPEVSGELAADTIAAAGAGISHAAAAGPRFVRHLMGDQTQSPTFGERYTKAKEDEGLLSALLRSIPRPTTEGIDAAVQSIPALLPGGETPGAAYDRNRFAGLEKEAAMRAAHPVASTAGDIGGDVATLLIGRRSTGVDKLLQRAETRLGGGTTVQVAENLAQDLGKVVRAPAWQRLARGTGRSLEAGIEAAALDVLKDPSAEPIETAAIAAGGQLVGSGALQGAKGLVSGTLPSVGIKLTVAAVAAMGLIQTFKSAAPGGRDRILESAESGFDKVMLMLGLGVGSAALGATRYGRGNIALSDQTRTLLDGLATVHRGSTLSVLSDWTEGEADDRAAIERALAAISNDPTYRGETDKEREIVQRIRSGAGLVQYRTGGSF